jgi:ribonuclease E
MERAMPQNLRKLRLYQDPVPLFTRFQIESQIESAFSHTVTLPSGGALVIEQTEALVSIDINSARATKGEDIEATAFATNLEAADEVARQCRLRDLGGLLVVDFIDMASQRNQRDVENRLRDAMRMDRARVQIGRISRFGLLELSRQRLRPSLGESAHQTCPRCNGAGHIRSVESLALAVLRLVGEEARKDRSAKVIAQLPVDVATYLLNEKRDWISAIEQRDNVQLILIANEALETPNFTLRRVRDDQVSAPENTGASYALAAQEQPPSDAALDLFAPRVKAEEPVVVPPMPATPAPVPSPPAPAPQAAASDGVFKRMRVWLFGRREATPPQPRRQDGDRQQPGSRRDYGGGRHRGPHGRSRGDDRGRGGRGSAGDQRDYRQQGQQGQQGGQTDGRDQRNMRSQRPGGGFEGNRPNDRQGSRGDGHRGGGDQPRQQSAQGQGQARGDQNHQQGQQGPSRRRSRSRRRGGRGSHDDRQGREGQAAENPGERAAPPFDQSGPSQPAATPAATFERADRPSDEARSVERPAESPARETAPAAPPQQPLREAESEPPRAPAREPPGDGTKPPTYTVWSSGPADASERERDSEP